MDEAEALADRIVILAAGRIVASGTPRAIGGRDTGASAISFTLPDGVPADRLPVLPGQDGPPERAGQGRVELRVPDPVPALHALTGWAMASGVRLDDMHVQRPSLEDIYLRLTAETR